MSHVIAGPEAMLAKATDLAGIGSTISQANLMASLPTTAVQAAAADKVSAAIAGLFESHGQDYQTFGAQIAAFHDQFVETLAATSNAYASTEAANVQQVGLDAINAPVRALLTQQPLGNGTD